MDASYKHPVVAVVGPTATGKTALGVALAEQFGGEVISADSMQIYKGLDVGTAKVTPEETHGIPHHGVDILEPDAPFSVADFTAMAGRLEQEIAGRGHLPILVGGTGLYVQSFLYGVRFTEEKAPAGLREQLAEELAQKGGAALYAELQQVDPEAAAVIHPNNQVRVLRALEHYRATGKKLRAEGGIPAAGTPLPQPDLRAGFPGPGGVVSPHRPAGGQNAGCRSAGGGRAGLEQPQPFPHRGAGHRLQGVLPVF